MRRDELLCQIRPGVNMLRAQFLFHKYMPYWLAMRGVHAPRRILHGMLRSRRERKALLEMLVYPSADTTSQTRQEMRGLARAQAETGDPGRGVSMYRTSLRRMDNRAEKIVSPKYEYVWICNPKVASRSIAMALLQADPSAKWIRGLNMDGVHKRFPESKGYFTFAFVRDPAKRIASTYRDKISLDQDNWVRSLYVGTFRSKCHGLDEVSSFADFLSWLGTPFGSDAVADRHWLSQKQNIMLPGGQLPDFVGHLESLDDDWREVLREIGFPHRGLKVYNAAIKNGDLGIFDPAKVRERYAEDYEIGGYA